MASTVTQTSRRRGAIYARFSTKFQRSIADQIRECLAWAEAHGIIVDKRHIFVDEGKSGRTHKREGFQALLAALAGDEIDVVICLSTNRLYRKMYRALQLVEEDIVGKGKRAVFVAQNIDTERTEFWRALFQVFAMQDEMQVQMLTDLVRAGHQGLALNGRVWGTITFGYVGEIIEGVTTKSHKPAKKWAIDPVAREWVLKIFIWFVVEEHSLRWIAAEMNRLGAPLPPRTTLARWTREAVGGVLRNRRYIGDWPYGRTETKWQAKAGYGRQVERDEPRLAVTAEHLRLIDDMTFLKAQELLLKRQCYGGRPKGSGVERDSHLVSGLLWCPAHERSLQITNTQGAMYCPACKENAAPALYSSVFRARAESLIIYKVVEIIRADVDLVARTIGKCTRHVEAMQAADPKPLKDLERQLSVLESKIKFVFANPGETEEDQKENAAELSILRRERAKLNTVIADTKKALGNPMRVPTEQEIEALVSGFVNILQNAAISEDREVRLRARRVVHFVTGGKIVMSQQGEVKPRKGWLRGTFTVNLDALVLGALDFPANADKVVAVSIDFRKQSAIEEIADEVVELFNQGLHYKTIARVLSERHAAKISHTLVVKALHFGLAARGVATPDGRIRRTTLSRWTVDPDFQEKLMPQVMEMYNADVLLVEIARKLDVDRNTVTAIVARWHREQGLPVPDGRERRSSLEVKSRPPKGNERPSAPDGSASDNTPPAA